MKRHTSKLFVLMLAFAMVASACSGGTDDTTATDPVGEGSEESTNEDVNNPGLLVHAADDEPSTLDPAQVEPGEGGETVIFQVYERLLEIGRGGPDLVPGLATEVPTPENGPF